MTVLDQILYSPPCPTPSLLCVVVKEEVLDGKTLSTAHKGTGFRGCFTQTLFHKCPVHQAGFCFVFLSLGPIFFTYPDYLNPYHWQSI